MEKRATLPCVKAEKRRGEATRRALKDLKLLRTDVRISTTANFIYLPLIRGLNETERVEIEALDVSIREFELLEQRRSIEELVGSKPSFEIVGDIAVLTGDVANEQLMAEAIMNLHKSIKVVVKRESHVEGVFRNRRLKIIAGENRTETVHKENGCKYRLDLERVYFNPRLARERSRVALLVPQAGIEEIIDMFAGVGSFSIQIAKRARQSRITAIDINPEAVKYLRQNIKLNGVRNIDAIEGDIRGVYVRFINRADRIIMNLPKSAYLFLDLALSMLKPEVGIIHFYALESSYSDTVRAEERHKAAINKAKAKLAALCAQHEIPLDIQNARKVKDYAPYAYIIGIDAVIRKRRI
ncbi:MAG: class I SAM-dependent methyltransferase family protein [Halobacteriota archaeon]